MVPKEVADQNMRVERYNYQNQFEDCLPSLLPKLQSILVEGSYILSEHVRAFERAFAEFIGARHALGVNCGTDAVTIALKALNIGRGDEVITQANTFHATVLAIVNCGATPVLVDADDKTFLMDQTQLSPALTSRTRVILPVHLYGKPLPLDYLSELSEKYGVAIVEDACQAHGAGWADRRVGALGILGCFSFHPSKNLAAAGDGGAITTNSDALAKSIGRMRAFGQEEQNNHVTLGFNSRLDAVQAAILLSKLPKLDEWNRKRRSIAAAYREHLCDLPLTFQQPTYGEDHVYHLFQVRTDSRDELLRHLRDDQIDAVVRYPVPIHMQPAFVHLRWKTGQYPVAETLSRELLAIPMRPDMKDIEVDYVCNSIRRFFVNTARRARKVAV